MSERNDDTSVGTGTAEIPVVRAGATVPAAGDPSPTPPVPAPEPVQRSDEPAEMCCMTASRDSGAANSTASMPTTSWAS